VHPELADGATETENDDVDHSYFNSKLDLPPQPITPPPLPARRPPIPSQFARNLMSRRGRPRTVTAPATNYYSREDRYVTVVDRRERRNKMRIEKEVEDRVKHLRRETCARSRSIDEHRTMGRGEVLSSRQSELTDDGTEVTGVADTSTSSPLFETYPYLDHCYFCSDPDKLQLQWKAAAGRPEPPVSAAASAFEECETMLLGLPASGRGQGKGRRGRGRGRDGWTVVSRHSTLGGMETTREEVDQIDPAIRDLDLLAESELLLRPAGDYSILQDILGPHCISTSHPTPASTTLHQAVSPIKSPCATAVRVSHEPSITSHGGLNDSLSLDEASAAGGPSDLDDIELCEDDYRLFDPQRSASTQDHHQGTVASSAAGNPRAMRLWASVTTLSANSDDTVRKFEAESGEKDHDRQHQNLAVVSNTSLSADDYSVKQDEADTGEDKQRQPRNLDFIANSSLSADDFDDETRSATSEPAACTSFDTETDHDMSIPHDDDDDYLDTDAGDTEQHNY